MGMPVNPELNISANNAYKVFPPATPEGKSAAAPVVRRIASALLIIDMHPPVTDASVRSVLANTLRGLVPTDAIQVSSEAADIPRGIGYGVLVQVAESAACVHGWASVRGSGENVTGLSPDGGCLSLLGH